MLLPFERGTRGSIPSKGGLLLFEDLFLEALDNPYFPVGVALQERIQDLR